MSGWGTVEQDWNSGNTAADFPQPAPMEPDHDDHLNPTGGGGQNSDMNCRHCGQPGHFARECPDKPPMLCRVCEQSGHIAKECPSKPAQVCKNCGQEGHVRQNCENARVINRDHVADMTLEAAWEKIKQAAEVRDADDAKEAVQEYVKAMNGACSYREIQEGLISSGINLWFIATERPLLPVFTNMDLQGNMGKKFTISYRFSEKPERPREAEGWPRDREEILARLDDAGDPTNTGKSLCNNCGEVGHISRDCEQEKEERERPKVECGNCGTEGHRVRDCPQPRVDRDACRNCGKSGHRSNDCEEPPNMDNVECRKCNEKGHFAKDCPTGGGFACRNCGNEGHKAAECDQPRNMDSVTCRNCEKTGHMSRDCPEPKDWSKVQCSNCQEFGHTKVRCKKLPAESEEAAGFPQDSGATTCGLSSGSGTNNAAGAQDWSTNNAAVSVGNDSWGAGASSSGW